MAPLVDQVLAEQMKRYRVYAAGGAKARYAQALTRV